MAAFFGPMVNTAQTVTMLLKPSLMPGTGDSPGSCNSTIKMVSAMAVSSAIRVISLVFINNYKTLTM